MFFYAIITSRFQISSCDTAFTTTETQLVKFVRPRWCGADFSRAIKVGDVVLNSDTDEIGRGSVFSIQCSAGIPKARQGIREPSLRVKAFVILYLIAWERDIKALKVFPQPLYGDREKLLLRRMGDLLIEIILMVVSNQLLLEMNNDVNTYKERARGESM
jgi:hypothetical protein